MSGLLGDVRHAWRQIVHRPAVGAAAVLMLAAGIGGTAAIFSVVDAVLLRPLPFAEPERLSFLTRTGDVSLPDAEDWRRESRTYTGIALFLRPWAFDLTGTGEPERLKGSVVEPGFFEVLGTRPLLGRVLTAEDDKVGGPRVAVVSEGFWKRRLGGGRDVVGRDILLSDRPTTIVGVVPDLVDFLEDGVEVWVPAAVETPWAVGNRGTNNFDAIGRLAPAATHDEGRAEILALTARLAEEYPRTNRGKIVDPLPMIDFVVGRARPALLAVLAAVGLVLLVSCANLAGVLLARLTARQGELGVRLAIGAGRGRLARLVVVEAMVLAGAGGAVGVGLAALGADVLEAALSDALPRLDGLAVDLRVLCFAVMVTVLTGVAASLLPAWHVLRRDPVRLLQGDRAGVGRGTHRTLAALVSAEVGLAVVLLAGSGLLLRTFVALRGVDLGFEPRGVVTGELVLPESRYADLERQTWAVRGIVDALQSLPGVEAASLVVAEPLAPRGGIGNRVLVEGRPVATDETAPGARARPVHGEYFRAIGTPIVEGRGFSAEDHERAPRVAVVNEAFVRAVFPGERAVGRRIAWRDWNDGTPEWMTIVGVATDARYTAPEDGDTLAVYTPYVQRNQAWQRFGSLVVRTKGDPRPFLREVQQAVWTVDPTLPLDRVEALEDRFDDVLAPRRLNALAVGGFALVALAVALCGLYAVLAWSVESRRREIGVRMALGADSRRILGLVLRRGLTLTVVGVLAGMLASVALARVARGLLFGVPPVDVATLAAVSGGVLAAALIAGSLPARRAARIDPFAELRGQ